MAPVSLKASELIVLVGAAFGFLDRILNGVLSKLFANGGRDVDFGLVC